MGKIYSLDYSTTCSGYAIFDLASSKLESYGVVKNPYKGPKDYPAYQLNRLRAMADAVIATFPEDLLTIVVEEINAGKNRINQKTLSGGHYLFLDRLGAKDLYKVVFYDTDGATGWRSAKGLGLQLSKSDKLVNKENQKLNKKLPRGKKLPKITQKTLCCRFVNKTYGLELTEKENDIADAIGLGHYYLHHIWNR